MTRRKFHPMAVTGLLTLVCILSAQAQPGSGSGRGPHPFAAFDRDRNEMISEQEFNEFRRQRQRAMAEQGRMMRGARNAPSFADIDANGDGQISPDEMRAMQQQRMQQRRGMRDRMPQNMGPGSGMMGRGMGPGMMGQGPMHQGRGMGWGPRDGRGPGPRGMGRNHPGFASFDANGDGRVDRQEFTEGRNRRMQQRAQQGYPMRHAANAPPFEAFDADGDGTVSAQEFADFRERRMRQRWQQR